MFEKDLMKDVSEELSKMSDAEKDKRIKSLQQLLDAELKRREAKGAPPPVQPKPKPKRGFWALLFGKHK